MEWIRLPPRQTIWIIVCIGIILAGSACVVYANRLVSNSKSTPSSVGGLRSEMQQSIKKQGGENAYAVFKDEYAGKTFDEQHNAAHLFGEMLFDVEGLKGLTVCDSDLNFGCYHGYLSKAISKEGLNVISRLDNVCATAEGIAPTACQHGIGHGIVEYMGHAHLSEALLACDKTNQPNPLAGCTSGVFMEYNVPLNVLPNNMLATAPRKLSDRSKPYDVCPTLDQRFQSSCYHELPQWWLQVYSDDFKVLASLCDSAPGDSFQNACFGGVGQIIASSAGYEVEKTKEFCSLMPTEHRRNECLYAGAKAFSFNIGDTKHAEELCNVLPDTMKEHCLN